MKKKNVVKRETREKKTYERTPIKVQKTTVNKQSTVIESVVDVHEEKETIKKQHIKKTKPQPVDTVMSENIVDDKIEKNTGNNEQNI